MRLLDLDEIKKRIDLPKIFAMQEDGFRAFSAGNVDVPPVGYLKQNTPPGSYHIKYGLIKNDSVWVVKIVGGPNDRPLNGMMVVISTQTGQPEAILQDNGYLTQLRTAMAGLISAKYLAPNIINAIGVIGTGGQARMQVDILKDWTDCRNVFVWGRNPEKSRQYKEEMEQKGFSVTISRTPSDLAKNCNLIITTTSAREPLLHADDIQSGTHITAMGADAPGKIELDPQIIAKADIVVVDNKSQCIDHGEICRAYKQGFITNENLIELGQIIDTPSLRRKDNHQITISDLTGVAVQDIQIAKAVLCLP
ncbi:MAG: ornithine cyclodeaminase family protein [Alphaproteobacteria bacterium]|nr:ornithine cyclodeaminase family protein [Alphaproteobacteria bacterium]MCB9985729.1 ornithine cyclodeaminase family protein [Micavibrio sp.]